MDIICLPGSDLLAFITGSSIPHSRPPFVGMHWGHRFVTPVFFRLVKLVCGLSLGFFALKLLWSTLLLLKG